MASLSTLKSQLRNLQSSLNDAVEKREDAVEKRDMAKKRRDAVRKIWKDLEGDFDNNCRGINKVADQMEGDVSQGLKGISNASKLDTAIGADKEVNPDYEANLSLAIQELEAEYNDLDQFYDQKKKEASDLKSEINSLNWSITCKKNEIRAEEQRLEWEAYQRYLAELAEKALQKDKK